MRATTRRPSSRGAGPSRAARRPRSRSRRRQTPGGPPPRAIFLGSLYAAGHGTVVTALGLLALLAAEFLPSWIDPVMERIVGVTLVLLAASLFYSLYRYFRGQGEFKLRSRWML